MELKSKITSSFIKFIGFSLLVAGASLAQASQAETKLAADNPSFQVCVQQAKWTDSTGAYDDLATIYVAQWFLEFDAQCGPALDQFFTAVTDPGKRWSLVAEIRADILEKDLYSCHKYNMPDSPNADACLEPVLAEARSWGL